MQIPECKTAMQDIQNHTLAGWFYHHHFQACLPYYSVDGIVHCKENEDLFMTKFECDEVCGM